MSKEALVEFFQTIEKDPALSQRLTAIEDPAEVAQIAESELGLNVTAEELTSAVASMQESEDVSPEVELNEEELEAVAGGCIFPNWKIIKLPSVW